jgi:hypothetical protein
VQIAHRQALDAWLLRHRGTVTAARLLDLGVTPDEARYLRRSGHLVPLFPGTYRCASHPETEAQRLAAICAHNPAAVIGATTASRHFGVRGMQDGLIHVLSPHGSSPQLPGVVVHRTRQLEDVDVCLPDDDGVRFSSPARALLDASAMITAEAVESAIEQLLLEQTCTLTTLIRTASRLYHPRRPGSRLFRDVLMARPPWRNAARSELERRFRDAVERCGLPAPEVNHKVMLSDGTVLELDLAWPIWRVDAEIDHPFWHDRTTDIRRDKRRDRKGAVDGWLTVRFTDVDVTTDLATSLEDLTAILRSRGWTPGE